MTVLLTFSAHVYDWRALRNLHAEALLRQVKEVGAARYRVFRNTRNAAEMLILVELSAYEDAPEVVKILDLQLQATLLDSDRVKHAVVSNIWEDMGWEESDDGFLQKCSQS